MGGAPVVPTKLREFQAQFSTEEAPGISGCQPLAGQIRVFALREPQGSQIGAIEALVVYPVPTSAIGNGRHSSSQHRTSAFDLVLGCLPDDYGQAWLFYHFFGRRTICCTPELAD